jgi:hypothetical protein
MNDRLRGEKFNDFGPASHRDVYKTLRGFDLLEYRFHHRLTESRADIRLAMSI